MTSSLSTPIYLSTSQVNVLRGLFAGSAVLSIAGSSVLVYRLLRGAIIARKKSKVFDRLVLGLSISDIIMSLQNFVFPVFFYPFTQPSLACSIDGFMTSVSHLGPFYNCSLSFFYLLTLVYNVKDVRLQRVYEPIMHGISITLPIVSATTGAILQVYNPIEFSISCWSNTFPTGCEGDACIRSNPMTVYLYGIVTGAFPTIFVQTVLIANCIIIFRTIRKAENKTQKYQFTSFNTRQERIVTSGAAPSDALQVASSLSIESSANTNHLTRKQSLQVAHQSFFWVLAFFLSFVGIAILYLLWTVDPEGFQTDKYYSMQALNALLYPLQGLFNVLVYVRPRYLRWRQKTDLSRYQCLHKTLFRFESPPRRRLAQSVSGIPISGVYYSDDVPSVSINGGSSQHYASIVAKKIPTPVIESSEANEEITTHQNVSEGAQDTWEY